jgi:hypothetical protein
LVCSLSFEQSAEKPNHRHCRRLRAHGQRPSERRAARIAGSGARAQLHHMVQFITVA